MDDQQQQAELDELLWAYPPASFLPHQMVHNSDTGTLTDTPAAGINLNPGNQEPSVKSIYINLSSKIPSSLEGVERLVEVVIQEPSVLAQTRQHFKFYRDQGYPIQSHPINA